MKKIIFLLWQDKPGGIEVLLPRLIENLSHIQFEAFVFRPPKDNSLTIFYNKNIAVKYGSYNNILLLFKLIRFLVRNKNHIYHGFNLGPFIFSVLKFFKLKSIIYSIHGTIYWKNIFKKLIFKILWNLSIKKNDCFIANSNYSKEIFQKKISKKPDIKVIYNPIDTKKFVLKKEKIISNSGFKICYAGRLADGKNLPLWIDIAEYILNYFPDSFFSIYGEGPLKNVLNEHIKKKGLDQKIQLKGHIERVENAYYENDLMLFLSKYESFGNVVVESVLCGTPVIVSQIPSMQEIFSKYPQFIVPLDGNIKENVLKKLKNYNEFLEITYQAAFEFKNRFSTENHIKQIVEIYEKFNS